LLEGSAIYQHLKDKIGKFSGCSIVDPFSFAIVCTRVGELIYYHGPHKLWIIAGGPQITIDLNLKFYFCLTTRDRGCL